MFKEIIESTFFCTFPKKENSIVCLIEKTHTGTFSLVDTKFCSDCSICKYDITEQKNLLIESSTEVNSLKLEQVFELVKDNLGENCDYILGDDNKVVLIEMTCSKSEYVDCTNDKSKRTKARSQLKNTLYILNANKIIWNFLERKNSKHVIFSWKNKYPINEDDIVEKRFLDFSRLSDEIHSNENIQKFDLGFDYREIRYPNVLLLDKL